MIRVQSEDFVADELMQQLRQAYPQAGALASFVGCVRAEQDDQGMLQALQLEHYPGMTEKALDEICHKAEQRWPLLDVRVIHRVGDLDIGDQIVFVGVSSAHRGAAFEACEFIMDYLKTRAPFWKRELNAAGDGKWVDARDSDDAAAARWGTPREE